MTVWEDPSFDEISVKQPCGCQSRYSCGTVGLRWPWHAEGGHGTTNLPHQILTQLQGVTRSLTDVGQKTLGWSLLYFFPQSHCSLPVHTPLETLAFHNSFCISKHGLHCTVWGSVRVPLDPAAGYSHQDDKAAEWIEGLLCHKPDLHLSVPGVPLYTHPFPTDFLFPVRKASNTGLDVECVSQGLRVHGSFPSEFRQGYIPRLRAFWCFSWLLRCFASICTLLCRLEGTARLKQWFQLFLVFLVALMYQGKFGFWLLRHSSAILVFFPLLEQ